MGYVIQLRMPKLNGLDRVPLRQ